MRLSISRLRTPLFGVLFLTSLGMAYWVGHSNGYRAGLNDKGPDHRALMVVRRTKGKPHSYGTSATWYNVRDPADAAKLKLAEKRLKAAGAEYYVAKGRVETTLSPNTVQRRISIALRNSLMG